MIFTPSSIRVFKRSVSPSSLNESPSPFKREGDTGGEVGYFYQYFSSQLNPVLWI